MKKAVKIQLVSIVIDQNDKTTIGKSAQIESTMVVFLGVSCETLRIPNRIPFTRIAKHNPNLPDFIVYAIGLIVQSKNKLWHIEMRMLLEWSALWSGLSISFDNDESLGAIREIEIGYFDLKMNGLTNAR